MATVRRLPSSALAALRLSAILAAGLLFGPATGPAWLTDGAFDVIDSAADPQLQFGPRLEIVLERFRLPCLTPFTSGRSANFEMFLCSAP